MMPLALEKSGLLTPKSIKMYLLSDVASINGPIFSIFAIKYDFGISNAAKMENKK